MNDGCSAMLRFPVNPHLVEPEYEGDSGVRFDAIDKQCMLPAGHDHQQHACLSPSGRLVTWGHPPDVST